ncbi:glycosyltransferase family protein [Thalassococcus sp. S3]|uniref:glycosyltransferase family protein n=1 Tax=Thalassococcus sp. S3 TaxID=2017482 RepID=UPI0010245483|nr:glycosyltransferase [Thalassococcus sp. S3]QBF30668.1 glycosyltransferase [Thalassococcus sp. S3]
MKVFIAVTHLLGTGHLRRADMLARAFAARGDSVCIASGGLALALPEMPGISRIQLPPLKSDGTDFSRLLTADGSPASSAYLANRTATLCNAMVQAKPDILITELFPFGRRSLNDEFLALLERAHDMQPRPRIYCSIRDILAPPSKPAKAERTDDIVTRYYDGVLVHSDPDATPLEASWPVSDRLSPYLRYTGYVAPEPPEAHPRQLGADDIIVSAGGGPVGNHLFETAARAASDLPDRTWRLLVGGSEPASVVTALKAGAPANLIVEPARSDFRQMLRHAACSVSLCGYNTALDVLQTGIPALFVPFDDGKEVEQGLRAQSLSSLPAISVMRAAEMTAAGLADAVSKLCAEPRREPSKLRMSGASETVRIAKEHARTAP